ncbi:uncharacterized protein [Ptychodera flava]|uniref:uncharacterized protein n=1 Tax=Ptychodera flava TaxID=63121 RepID=UPI003969C691
MKSLLMTLSNLSDPENIPKRAEQVAEFLVDRYPTLYEKIARHLHQNYNLLQPTSMKDRDALEVAYRITRVLWITSGVSADMCREINKASITHRVIDELNDLKDSVLAGKSDHFMVLYTRSLLGTLLNVIRRSLANRQPIRDRGTVELLQVYLQGDVTDKCYALIILAYLVDEKENEKITAVTDNVNFLTSLFQSAVESKNHKLRTVNFTFNAVELARAIFMFIVYDTAKKIFADQGLLSSTVKLLQRDCNESEQVIAASILWSLAFDYDVRKKILKRKDCVKALKRLRNSPSIQVRKACIGALWEIIDKDRNLESSPSTAPTGHLMISYQSEDEELALELTDGLKVSGYNVWIDVKEMAIDSSLKLANNAIQEAIKSADAVILCASTSYMCSTKCRSEAEFSRELEKDIIVTTVQSKVLMDGWLGKLAGDNSRIFDLSDTNKLEENLPSLVEEVGKRGKQQDTSKIDAVDSLPAPDAPVESWEKEDVAKWLRKENLGHLIDKFEKYNGKELLALLKMLERAPSFFYDSMKNDLGIQKTHDIALFTNALEKLDR